MKEPIEDFLDDIKRALLTHEEPYDDGAWERFVAKNKPASKRRVVPLPLWGWLAGAAAVIAGIILVTQYFRTVQINTIDNKGTEIVTKTVPKENNITIIRGDSTTQNGAYIKPHIIKNTDGPGRAYLPSPIITDYPTNDIAISKPEKNAVTQPPVVIQKPQPSQDNGKFWENKVVKENGQPDKPINDANTKPGMLVTEPVLAHATQKEKKWQSSLYLSPTYGDLGVKMGYGYSIGYAVNNKVKISTGLAHTKISAIKNYGAPAAPSIIAATPNESNTFLASARTASVVSNMPYLDSVENLASGIEIPLDVNYNLSKNLYMTGGVSGLIVLKNSPRYTYVNNQNVRITVENSSGLLKEDKILSLSDYNTTSSPISENGKQPNLIGFYNFSMGYKQKVSGRNAVSIEPFVKVPMKNVTDQKLNYLGMGMRVKLDF